MDDATLVERSLAGHAEAFGDLVARYEQPLFNVALRMLRDREDARDAAQSAFVKAWSHLDRFDRRRKFFSWIYRILVNDVLHRIARRKSQEPIEEWHATDGRDPLEDVEAQEGRQLVNECLATLSTDHQQVLLLRHWLDLSYGEMADALGLPEKTVKSRLFTARQKLGETLKRHGVRVP